MARSRSHGNGRLEDALATLIQIQAAFVAQMRETDRRMAEAAERFARIETLLLEHSRILQEHSRILQAMPEAVHEKFGFQPPVKS